MGDLCLWQKKLFQPNSWSPATWLPASECSPSKRADDHLLWVWQEQLGEAVLPDWHSQPQHSEHPRKPTVNCVIDLRLIDPSVTISIVIFSYYPRECFYHILETCFGWQATLKNSMLWLKIVNTYPNESPCRSICNAFKVPSRRPCVHLLSFVLTDETSVYIKGRL